MGHWNTENMHFKKLYKQYKTCQLPKGITYHLNTHYAVNHSIRMFTSLKKKLFQISGN